MSSGLLYLAIVGVWALVLVPMWVRSSDAGEERAVSGEIQGGWRSALRRLARPHPAAVKEQAEDAPGGEAGDGQEEGRAGGGAGDGAGEPTSGRAGGGGGGGVLAIDDDAAAAYAVRTPRAKALDDVHPARRRVGRARIIARRRRRLTGIAVLTIAAAVLAVSGVAAWWVVPAPAVLLVTYLACLRAASDHDRELHARRLARAVAERRSAEIAEVVPGPGRVDAEEERRAQPFDQYAPTARAVGD